MSTGVVGWNCVGARNQPEGFRHAAERIDCSTSVERASGMTSKGRSFISHYVGNVDLYFGVNALT